MPVIRTKTNLVEAYEIGEEDEFVQLVWHGPHEDGCHLTNFICPPLPIARYQELVDWAVGMADQMRFYLRVVPIRACDVFKPREVLRALPHLDDQVRGRLRAFIVRAMAQVMRDCPDRAVRTDAHTVMTQLGAIPR